MNVQQIATHYKVTRQTVYNWVYKGAPHTKVLHGMRKVLKFDLGEVERWIQEMSKL